MDFMSLIYVMLFATVGWFWLTSIRVLEITRNVAKQACIKADVQFPDDTVASIMDKVGTEPLRSQGVSTHLPF
jgi:hypothetical protein